jgi:hypothetical protein
MNMKDSKIDELSKTLSEARERCHALSMRNITGLSEVERMQLDIDYQQALKDFNKAQDDLRDAML